MFLKNFKVEFLLFLFLNVLFLLNFCSIHIWIGGDSLPISLFKDYILNQMYAWSPTSALGGVSFSSVYFFALPLYFILDILNRYFSNLTLYYIYNYFVFIMLPFSFYFFISYFSNSKYLNFILTLFFSFHILTYVSISRNIINISFLFILTPIIIRFLYNLLEDKSKNLNIFILLFLIIFNSIVNLNPWTFIIQVISVVIFLLHYHFSISKINFIKFKKLILYFFIIYWNVFTFFFINYNFLVNNDSILTDSWNRSLINKNSDFFYNSIRGVVGDIFTRWGNLGGEDFYPISNNFQYTEGITVVISFIPVLLMFFLFLLQKDFTKSNFILLIVFILMILLLGINTSLNFFNATYFEGSFLSIFRNPQQKFSLIYLLILSVFIAEYFKFINRKNLLIYYISIVLILIYIVSFNYKIINGNFIPKNNLVNFYDLNSNYNRSISYINSNSEISRIYLLPLTNSTWHNLNINYEGYHIFHYSLYKKRIFNLNDLAFSKYNSLFIEDLKKSIQFRKSLISNEMRKLNIDTIVYDKNVNRYPRFSIIESHLKNIKFLNSDPNLYLDKVFGDIYIYRLRTDLNPILYSNEGNLYFKKINPSKFSIRFTNLNGKNFLFFLEAFHKNWKLYIAPLNKIDSSCEILNESSRHKYNQLCNYDYKFFEGEELKYLYEKPLFEESHNIVYEYANQWTIDPEYIKANFDKSYYKENPDGSIDVELVLYFRPQSYFYLGIVFSLATLTICIIYLIYDSVRQRKKINL